MILSKQATLQEEWASFYKKYFNWDVDFSKVVIPPEPPGKWRLLFIPKGMTMNRAFTDASKLFGIYKTCDNLDVRISKHARTAYKNYAVWVRDEIEPLDTLGKSAREMDPDMKIGITLLERIIFEIKYFTETNKHLDIRTLTLCSGSRYLGGKMLPCVGWYDDDKEVRVGSYFLDDLSAEYGVRSVGGR